MRHLIDFADMTNEEWYDLYALAKDIMARPLDYKDALRGRVMASLFYEPSTRTNFSFQTAMLKLGGGVFGFVDANTSSVSKGEKLKDTITMCSTYADVIVMRTPVEGMSKAASLYARAPLINAGDGGHFHPTQTLADLTAITERRGSLENMTVGLCGDLKYGRTVHSLVRALSRFPGSRFVLISPKALAAPQYLLDFLREKGIEYRETESLEEAIPELDILYMTRVQRERFDDPAEYERLKNVYVLTASMLTPAKKDMTVLHPLPRVDEIAMDVDGDERAYYFRQAECGLYVRMALLLTLVRGGKLEPEYIPPETRPHRCHNPKCITWKEPYIPILDEDGRCGYCEAEL